MNISLRIVFRYLIVSSILFALGSMLFSTPQIPNILYIFPAFYFIAIYFYKSVKFAGKFHLSKQELFYFLVVLFYTTRGILHGNTAKNILYDLVMLTIPVIIYAVSKNFFNNLNEDISDDNLRIDLNKSFWLVVPSVVFFGPTMGLFALVILYYSIYAKSTFNYKFIFVFILILGLVLIKGSKAYLLIIAINYFLLMYIRGRTLRALVIMSVVLWGLVFLNNNYYAEVTEFSSSAFKLFALINYFDLETFIEAFSNLDNALIWEAVDKSTGQRVFEFITVTNELLLENNIWLGEGLGGSADLSQTQDLSIVSRREGGDVSDVRVFHLMLTWLLNKTGIVGFTLFVLYLISLLNQNKEKLSETAKIIYYSIWVAFFFKISVTFGAYLVQYYFPILFGYFSYLNKKGNI